jgi:hypothetical protein
VKEPTKADLAAAVAKLTEENAGLRDLLAAVRECARAVPQAVYDHQWEQLRRATNVLIAISVVADAEGTWAWSWASGQGAAHLRERAAEPLGYEVYQTEGDELHAAPEPEAQECTDYDPAYKLHGCELDAGHDGPHRNLLGVEWTETLKLPCPSHPEGSHTCTLHLGHFPVLHLAADGAEWTDEIYKASGPRKPETLKAAS